MAKRFSSMNKRFCEIFCTRKHLSALFSQVEISLEILFKCVVFVLRWRPGKMVFTDKNVLLRDVNRVDSFDHLCEKRIRRMSFLSIFMGTALIYPQSGANGPFEIHFWNNCAFVFCGEGEKWHFECSNPFHK